MDISFLLYFILENKIGQENNLRIFLYKLIKRKRMNKHPSIEKYIPFLEENVPRNCFKSRDFLHEKGEPAA